jgi:hypothetical protein
MAHYLADSDSNGNIIGFYADEVHELEQIPVTAIPITEEQWQACLEEQGKWIIKDRKLVLDLVNYPPPYVEPEPIPKTDVELRLEATEAALLAIMDLM